MNYNKNGVSILKQYILYGNYTNTGTDFLFLFTMCIEFYLLTYLV